MNCPVCNIALTMTERQSVEIDYCPRCRGVWLDRGELDKIIERSAGNPQTTKHYYESHERHSEHDDYSHSYKKKKKRESFLSDLFDF